MSTCYKCGSSYSGYGSVCPTCKQTEALKDHSEKALRLQHAMAEQQSEMAEQVSAEARRQTRLVEAQLELSLKQAAAQVALDQLRVQEAEKQTEQAEIQTKLLLEQSISNNEAYQQGYELVLFIQLDPNNPDSEVLHHHDLSIGLRETGEVYAETIEPDFITPRLKKAYFDGVTERLRKDFSAGVSLDYLKQKAYEAGLNEFSIYDVEGNDDKAFQLSYHEDGTDITFSTDWYHPGVFYSDSTANTINGIVEVEWCGGKMVLVITNEHIFENPELNAAFKKGLLEYLESENSPVKCQGRREKIEAHGQLVAQKQSENQRNENEYSAAIENWERGKNNLMLFEIGLKILGGLLAFGLIYTGHWFYFIVYLIIYWLLLWLNFPRMAPPVKPQEEPIQIFYDGYCDDDPLYEEAFRIVMATKRPSISLIQRDLRIGYDRASRLIERMEKAGLVSSPSSDGSRRMLHVKTESLF